MSAEALRITVARQLAALRRQGWTTPQALAFVTPALDAGSLRRALEGAAHALRGAAPAATDDVLAAVVARGDAASADALDCLAAAWEAGESARRRLRSTAVLLGTATVGPLLLATFAGWMGLDRFLASMVGGQLPGLTGLTLWLVGLAKWAGLPVGAAALALLWRGTRRAGTGGLEVDTAASLLQLAAALESGHSEAEAARLVRPSLAAGTAVASLGLSADEGRYLAWRAGSSSLATAVRELAREKLAAAEQRQLRFERYAPVVLTWMVVFLVGLALVAVMLPVFEVARHMR